MSTARNQVNAQINLIQQAMKDAGVWSNEIPEWICHYHGGPIVNIWQWLQFIHLPLRNNGKIKKPQYLAPQISKYVDSDPSHRQILQLVIELDSITSTLHKT